MPQEALLIPPPWYKRNDVAVGAGLFAAGALLMHLAHKFKLME
jgi:hypothetical protein